MPAFAYRGRNTRGDLINGVVEAGSIDAVASQLLNSSITPVDIREKTQQQGDIAEAWEKLTARNPDLTDLILFSRQMYSLMRAGVPIIRSMKGIMEATKNRILVSAVREVQQDLESGRELAAALARHPHIFPPLYVSMVRVGENTGKLDESFLRISSYLELEKDTRERIKSALRYPAMVIVAMAIAVGIINVFVIPAFAKIFERAKVELPLPTRILMATSEIFVDYWPFMVAALAAAFIAARYYVSTDAGLYQWGKWKTRLPLVGDIIKRATLARFARSFAMSLSAGVPLVQALTVSARAVDNEYVGEYVLNMRNGIERGEGLTRTAAATGMFTPLVLQMLSVGEETGQVDEMLEEVAGFYEREVDYDVKNLSATIEPVMILFMGALVLILALGVFLPMWDIATVSMGRG